MNTRRLWGALWMGALLIFGGTAGAVSGGLDSGGGVGENARFVLRATLGGAFHSVETATPRYILKSAFAIVGSGASARTGDFNADDKVDFADFLLFAGGYGHRRGDAQFDARLDLNRDDRIDFADFLLFAGAFGT